MRASWWWIDRWQKSTAYKDMTLAEQGAYRNLLDELWLRGGVLPDDERILARLCGDPLEWEKVRKTIMARFTRAEGGWRNETHDEVSGESSRRAEKQRRYRLGRGNEEGNAAGNEQGNKGRNVTPSPDPSPDQDQSPEPKTHPYPPGGREVARILEGLAPCETARELHDAAESALRLAGLHVEREFRVQGARADGRDGKIDLVVLSSDGRPAVGIELDRASPREKSRLKLKALGVPGIVVLREAPKGEYEDTDGLQIVGLGGESSGGASGTRALCLEDIARTPLDSTEFLSAWSDWEQVHGKYKPLGLKSQVTRIAAWGHDRAVAAVRYSIAQGSQGVYEEHGRNGHAVNGVHKTHAESALDEWSRKTTIQ